jgi:sister chromatid cohesion protein PDS5
MVALPVLSMTEIQNLYALSELAQHVIKDLAKRHSWTLQSFPMKVKLPTGILRPLPNAEAANKVLNLRFSIP